MGATPADVFVQFETSDVQHDHFTIFWGGKTLYNPALLRAFFQDSTAHLLKSGLGTGRYSTVLYTDQRQIRFPSILEDLLSIPSGETCWFIRFEYFSETLEQLSAGDYPPDPRFIVWGRIGDNTTAPSDSLGICMLPTDFWILKPHIPPFIAETSNAHLPLDDVKISIEQLGERLHAG
jgi:hypothetical protein